MYREHNLGFVLTSESRKEGRDPFSTPGVLGMSSSEKKYEGEEEGSMKTERGAQKHGIGTNSH